MLPVLIALLLGVTWVSRRHARELEVSARARLCAFRIATSGCESIPPECVQKRGAGRNGAGSAALDDARDRLESNNSLAGPLLSIPILGDALAAALPDEVDAMARQTVGPGPASSGEARLIEAHVTAPCNEVPSSRGLVKEVLGAVAKDL